MWCCSAPVHLDLGADPLGVLLLLQTDWRLALVAVVLTPLLLLSQVAFNPALARREQQRVSRAALLLAYAGACAAVKWWIFGLKASTCKDSPLAMAR